MRTAIDSAAVNRTGTGVEHGGAGGAWRWRLAFLLLLGAASLLRLWFAGTLPLSGDEAYHWEWARRPAFGYYDHPPLTAWLIALSTRLFGATEAAVRLPAVLLLALAASAVRALVRILAAERGAGADAAERAGCVGGLLILAAPIYAVFGVYMSTDPPLLGFWALALLGVVRAARDGRARDWALAGAALGLALNAKFLAALLCVGLGAACLLHADGRRLLRRPLPYAAALWAAALWAPFLWWNARNDWATFRFNFVTRQRETGWNPLHAPEFIAGQALALSPVLFVLALGAVLWVLRRRNRSGLGATLTAGSAAVPLLYLLWVSLRRQVGLHWAAGPWIGALALAACRDWSGAPPVRGRRRAWVIALGLCVGLTLLLHVAVHLPPRVLSGQWAYRGDPKRINLEKHAERYGWPELGRFVEDLRDAMQEARPDGAPGVFVICEQYGLAAQVAFYSPGKITTHLWAPRRTHGEHYRFWDDFAVLKGQDAVFVSKRERRAREAGDVLRAHFVHVGSPEALPIVVNGQTVRRFFVRRCTGFDGRTPVFGGAKGGS
jgi:hypothetical protein